MNRPPGRLIDQRASDGPSKDQAGDLLRTLQAPPRLDAAADARLAQQVARMGARSPSRRVWWAAVAIPAALAMVVFVGLGRDGRRDEGIRSRGPEHRAAMRLPPGSPPELLAFRIAQGGRSEPLGDVIRRSDELAFAYRTDGSEQRVLVFARDASGRLYWYHPAWSDPKENPEAVQLARKPGVHELPAAIAQSFRGESVEICGLFTTEPLRVRDVEQGLTMGRLRPDCRKVTVAP